MLAEYLRNEENQMRKLRGKVAVGILAFILTTATVYGNENKLVTPSETATGIYTVAEDGDQIPEMLAQSAIVVDMKTGYTLVEKNIYDKLYPASITKIMTSILTLEQVALDETVTFSHDAVYSIEAGSSAAYVDEGEQLSVEQCLYGLMLISGNDLANGLAEHVGGSMSEFAEMMTDKAKTIGCTSTNFTNAHGLHDENHYTTAYDMAMISKYAYDNLEMFRTLCSTGFYECQPTNKQPEVRAWRNNNKLINEYTEQYYEPCIGGKTGYTNQAGGTLVTYANINGRTLLCVVMKSTHSLAAYADTTALYEYVKNNMDKNIFDSLDTKYEEANKPQEVTTSKPEEQTTAKAVTTTSGAADKEQEDEGMWIGWKLLILAVTVFIIYYVYVRYMRYLKRKRKREQRMRRRTG